MLVVAKQHLLATATVIVMSNSVRVLRYCKYHMHILLIKKLHLELWDFHKILYLAYRHVSLSYIKMVFKLNK